MSSRDPQEGSIKRTKAKVETTVASLLACWILPTACAANLPRVGTIIVIAQMKDRIIIAADSRTGVTISASASG
jgi:hypothetical protein